MAFSWHILHMPAIPEKHTLMAFYYILKQLYMVNPWQGDLLYLERHVLQCLHAHMPLLAACVRLEETRVQNLKTGDPPESISQAVISLPGSRTNCDINHSQKGQKRTMCPHMLMKLLIRFPPIFQRSVQTADVTACVQWKKGLHQRDVSYSE